MIAVTKYPTTAEHPGSPFSLFNLRLNSISPELVSNHSTNHSTSHAQGWINLTDEFPYTVICLDSDQCLWEGLESKYSENKYCKNIVWNIQMGAKLKVDYEDSTSWMRFLIPPFPWMTNGHQVSITHVQVFTMCNTEGYGCRKTWQKRSSSLCVYKQLILALSSNLQVILHKWKHTSNVPTYSLFQLIDFLINLSKVFFTHGWQEECQ